MEIFYRISLFLCSLLIIVSCSEKQSVDEDQLEGTGQERAVAYYNLARESFPADLAKTEKNLEKSLYLSSEHQVDSILGDASYLMAKVKMYQEKWDEAVDNYSNAEAIYVAEEDWTSASKCNTSKNVCYSQLDSVNRALSSSKKALEYAEKGEYTRGQAIALMQIANSYITKGEYDEATGYLQRSIDIAEENKILAVLPVCYNNMGLVFHTHGQYEEALSYYRRAYNIQLEMQNWTGVADALNNIGRYFGEHEDSTINNVDSAKLYFESALEYYLKANDRTNLVRAYANLGTWYGFGENNDFEKGQEYFDKAYELLEGTNDSYQMCVLYQSIGLNYLKQGRFRDGLDVFKKALIIADSTGQKDQKMMAYMRISDTYDSLRNYDFSLKYYRLYNDLHEEVKKEQNDKVLLDLKTRYKTEENKRLLVEANEDKENQFRIIILFGVGLLVIILFSVLMVIQFLEKRKANKLLQQKNEEIILRNEEITHQKEEIEAQRDEIENQKDLIEDQQRGIMDSIHYASRIQQAILPQDEFIETEIGNHFVLFKPRDIVSGDFYWMNVVNNKKVIVAADCTGHGVPGAFMSMLGTAFLNDIGASKKDITAAQMLNLLRDDVIVSLKQTGRAGEAKDGMDLALYMLDDANYTVQFAGANNPLLIVRPKGAVGSTFEHKKIVVQDFIQEETGREFELINVKADKMPIGIYTQLKPFENLEVTVMPGDTLYTFSDGYIDQFGGPRGKKFMIKRMKQLLVDIYDEGLDKQQEILEKSLTDWQGLEEQVDDILVIGYKIM